MRTKIIMFLTALVLTGGSIALASDLEVVEQDQQATAPQEALVAATPLDAVVEAVATQEPQEAKSGSVPAAEPEAKIVRAEDEEGTATPQTTQKKVMPAPPAVAAKTDEPTRYTLGPDDVIEIVVRRHGEFSGQYPINSEGKIQYKFIGDIEVKGLSKTEIKEKISRILSKFIINPELDVTILEYRSKVIYVIGEVGAPGKYYMKADKISLREAIVQAGLPTLSASMRRTQLIRPDKKGKPMEKKVDLYALLYEGKLNLDQDMLPGDVVVVPATFFAKIMRIISPVAAPIGSADTIRRVGTGGF